MKQNNYFKGSVASKNTNSITLCKHCVSGFYNCGLIKRQPNICDIYLWFISFFYMIIILLNDTKTNSKK